MFRGQPVEEKQHAAASRPGQTSRDVAVSSEASRRVTASVQVEDDPARVGGTSRKPVGGNPSHHSGLDRHVRIRVRPEHGVNRVAIVYSRSGGSGDDGGLAAAKRGPDGGDGILVSIRINVASLLCRL